MQSINVPEKEAKTNNYKSEKLVGASAASAARTLVIPAKRVAKTDGRSVLGQ